MSLLKPGATCWRNALASRAAFLIDYQAYYAAVLSALQQARTSVFLLGWSFDPRTRLMPDGRGVKEAPDRIGALLIELARARPHIDIRVLAWRSSIAISASQEFFPHRAKGFFKDTGVDFRLDDTVPFGACHHQKVLIVDGQVAFAGSGDIAVDRWDSPAHNDADGRRLMPSGRCHGPRHEVMMVCEGPIVGVLRDLAAERWRRATNETFTPTVSAGPSPWPEPVPADFTDVSIGVARTEPAWRQERTVRENLDLTLAAIAEAKESLYIENQYFTAPVVAEAIAARLNEPEGPQIVLVSTGQSPSWFDRLTMDRARSVLIWRLRSADIFGRFRALEPVTGAGQTIIVHSKAMVVDDRYARVGSANLNNRSGGFDTECDLVIEAGDEIQRAAVAGFRDTLIGHFLGRTAEVFAEARARNGGMIGAIDALNRPGRLRPIEPPKMGAFGEFIAAHHLGDPATVHDSWRPLRRRETLYRRVRAAAQPEIDTSTTSGK